MKIHTIQLNIEDYKNGTEFMDAEQSGAYFHLLMACYQSKDACIPDDDITLARIGKVSPYKWKKIKPIILEKFDSFEKNSKKYFKNFRVNLELEKIKNLSEKRQKASQERWLYKDSCKNNDDANALQMHCNSNANNKLEDIKERKNNINPLTPLEDSEQNSNSEISGGEGIKNLSFDDIEKVLDKKTKNYINGLGSYTVQDLAKILIEKVNSQKKSYPECIKTEMIKLADLYINQSPSPYSVIKEESLSSENSEVKKKKNFKKNHVIQSLTDQDIELIKKAAPQWDLHNLAEEYVLAVNGGNLDQPILINRHFVAFCKGRAKGMPPP